MQEYKSFEIDAESLFHYQVSDQMTELVGHTMNGVQKCLITSLCLGSWFLINDIDLTVCGKHCMVLKL